MNIGWWGRDYAKGGKVVTADDLKAVLVSTFHPRIAPVLDDERYRAISVERFAEMVDRFRWKDPQYVPNKFDCDDFARAFMVDLTRAWAEHSSGEEPMAFGHMWAQFPGSTGSHRLGWQYDGSQVHLWEGQSNKRTAKIPSVVFEVRA